MTKDAISSSVPRSVHTAVGQHSKHEKACQGGQGLREVCWAESSGVTWGAGLMFLPLCFLSTHSFLGRILQTSRNWLKGIYLN